MSMPQTIQINLRGGLSQDESALSGNGYISLQNWGRYHRDSLRRRAGMDTRVTASGIVMSAMRISSTDYLIHLTSAGYITRCSLSSDAVATNVISGLAVATYGDFAGASNELFFSNGVDDMQYIDSELRSGDVGEAAPTLAIGSPSLTAGTETVDSGSHAFRYRLWNRSKNMWTDPSPAASKVISAGAVRVLFDIGATSSYDIKLNTDTTYDAVILEMTAAGGSTWFIAGAVSRTVANIAYGWRDAAIQAGIYAGYYDGSSYSYVTPPNYDPNEQETGNAPPPTGIRNIASHKGRLWGMLNGFLYWSGYGTPHCWNTAAQSRRVIERATDRDTGLASFDGDLYIFGTRSLRRFIYTTIPSEGVVIESPSLCGLYHQRLLIRHGPCLYGWGAGGIWRLRAMVPEIISDKVRDIIDTIVDASQVEKFHAVYEPDDNVILWFYVPIGGTGCTGCLVLDLDTMEWRTNDYISAVTSSTKFVDSDDVDRAWISTEWSHCWSLSRGIVDGVVSGQNHACKVVSSGAFTTFDVDRALQTSRTLAGVYAYRPSTDEERRITGNTVDTLSINSAFDTALVAGEEIWLGAMECIVEPKWILAEDGTSMVCVGKVHLQQIPVSNPASLTAPVHRIYYYKDFDDNPVLATADLNDTPPYGAGVSDAAQYVTADMDQQHVAVPGHATYAWAHKIKIVSRHPSVDFELTRLVAMVETIDAGDE